MRLQANNITYLKSIFSSQRILIFPPLSKIPNMLCHSKALGFFPNLFKMCSSFLYLFLYLPLIRFFWHVGFSSSNWHVVIIWGRLPMLGLKSMFMITLFGLRPRPDTLMFHVPLMLVWTPLFFREMLFRSLILFRI